MNAPLLDLLHALTRLMEAESEALAGVAGPHAPDALGTLAAAKARLLGDLERLGRASDDASLTAATAVLSDAILIHTAVVRRVLKKKFRRFDRSGRTRV